ncbi:hypothetical protein KAU08_12050 [bacterium]|nr:hypothetical protein [bacterium]
MGSLIDINARPETGNFFRESGRMDPDKATSLFKPREPTPEDRKSALVGYGVIGLLVGLGLSLVVFIVTMIATDGEPAGVLVIMFNFMLVAIVLSTTIGAVIAVSFLNKETEEGYLKISDDEIEYWTRNGIVAILMQSIFGARQSKETLFYFTRLYFTSDNKRGFEFLKHKFKRYEAVSGPATKLKLVSIDGNDNVRLAVMHHRRRRSKAGLKVGEVPKFNFQSIKTKKEQIIFGNTILDREFKCDGKILEYTIDDSDHKIAVEMINGVRVEKVQSQYGVSKFLIHLALEPGGGHENFSINALHMPYMDEIGYYCRAIATSFPDREDGYWD